MKQEIFMPDYLNDPVNINHYYGKLKREGDYWIIEGEPSVCIMAKKLFPGSSGKGRGYAKFKNHVRILGDLNWLMMRYPLIIEDKELWYRELDKVREHVVNRERINKYPQQSNIEDSYFNGKLFTYQQEGLGWILQNRRTLIGDEMGIGKTVQALSFIAKTKSYPAIIVVPPHLLTNWEHEIKKFLRVEPSPGSNYSLFDEPAVPKVHIIKGLTPYNLPNCHIHLIHYGVLRGWKEVLPNMGYKVIIYDEIQELRRADSQKYSVASLLSESCDNVIGLSGTPIYNRGGEIYNVLNIIDFHCLGDWDFFTREWCTGYGSDIVADPKLLGQHLRREGLMIRRIKKDVLKELPPKRRIVQYIDKDDKLFNTLIQETLIKIESLDGINESFKRSRLMNEISEATRRATGLAKAKHVCEFVKSLLEAGERVILFAYHHDVFDSYRDELSTYNPVFVTGRETKKQKDEAIKGYMSEETSVICVSLRASTGLNLQNTSAVIFGELDWSPAIHSQGEDRVHRKGAELFFDSICCFYMVASDSYDEEMMNKLGLKVSQFKGLMGEEIQSEEDVINDQKHISKYIIRIIERLKQKNIKKVRQ